MDRKVETISANFTEVFKGLDCEVKIKFLKDCEQKLELEIGDVIVYHPNAIDLEHFPCFGIVTQAHDDIIITIKWHGKFPPFNSWSKESLRNLNLGYLINDLY